MIKKIFFSVFDILSKPNDLYLYNDLYVVDIDLEQSKIYSQDNYGIWHFIGIVRKRIIKKD